MCVSVFVTTVAPVYALGAASNMLKVSTFGYYNNQITYTVSLKANQKNITGVILNAIYDPLELEVVKCVPVGEYDEDGEIIPDVSGFHECGPVYSNAGAHSMAYLSTSGYSVGSSDVALFKITFNAISSDRLITDVKFNCVEFVTDDSNSSNDILKSDETQTFYEDSFHTLNVPTITEVNSYKDGLKVVWSPEIGAENYYLYRVESSVLQDAIDEGNDVPWEIVGSEDGVGNVFSYYDSDAKEGTEYNYTLSAQNQAGITEYDEIGLAGTNFGTISSLTATEATGGAGALLNWSALDGADYYEIYRKLETEDDSAWKYVNSVDAPVTTFTDASVGSGVVYNYKVRAFQNSSISDAVYSADMSCDAPAFKYIAVPQTEIKNTFNGLEISFVPSFGADRFVIEKKTGSGEFVEYAEVLTTEITDGKYSVVDTDVAAEENYTYSIQAFAEDLNSARKELTSIKRLSQTTINSVDNASNGVAVSWKAVKDATGYTVYRKNFGATEFKPIANVTSTEYVDMTTSSGETYVYSVAARNATGNGDYAEEEKTIMYLCEPDIKSIAAVNEGIKMTWYDVKGAESYNIYRKSGNEAWALYAQNITQTEFTDARDDVTHGVEYSYTVEAIGGDYASSKNENGVQGMHFGVIEQISAVTTANGAKITWNNLSEADEYLVYRKTTNSYSWGTPIATVKTNSYEDTTVQSGIAYEYKVNARKASSIADMVCEPAGVKFLQKPTGFAKNVTKGIEIRVSEEINGADKYVIEKNVNGKYVKIGEIDATEKLVFVDSDVVAKQSYTYRIYAVAEATGVIPYVESAKFTTAAVKRIGAPEITKIVNTVPGIEFYWEKIEDATHYQILRKTGEDGSWVSIYLDKADETSYLDIDIDSGVKYYYTVNAITEDGGVSGYDETGKGITFIETPDLDYVKNTAKGVEFSWYDVPGAVSYTVWRRSSKSGWKQIGVATEAYYVDAANLAGPETYTYTVRAVAEDGNVSYYDRDGLSVKYLQAPKVSLSNYASGIQIKWNKVSGAKQYYVYKVIGGKWKQIDTVSSKVTSYKDTSVKNKGGSTYTYTVRAVNGKLASPYGTFSLKRLYTPKVTMTNYAPGIQVKWNKITGAQSYNVYRKYGSGGWKLIANVPASSTIYKDFDVNEYGGKTFGYTVRAVSGSSMSAYDSFSVKRLYVPALAAVKSTKSGIEFSWKKVTGASGYYVYRKTTGGWKKIATVKGGTKVKYVDKSAKKGTTYTYTVRAYSGSSLSYYNTKGLKCKDKY